jgi:hypothetical protein
MAFVYQVAFDLHPEQMSELAIGASLERVVGYMRSVLPSHAGYVSSRAMNSVESVGSIRVVLESVWETWDDLVAHRTSQLAETKVLSEFAAGIAMEGLSVSVYEDID